LQLKGKARKEEKILLISTVNLIFKKK
jgi:hypothetical protein